VKEHRYKQIAAILRHRFNSRPPIIYAKVDLQNLGQITQRWPEVHHLIDAVETYLAVRRTAGFDLRSEGKLLQSFARFPDAKSTITSPVKQQSNGLR